MLKPGLRAEADRSFERLYARHRGDVYAAALRELGSVEDAEDVTQAAFVDAYRALLRGSRPDSPRAWLLAIAENVRNRRFRAARTRPREEAIDPDAVPAPELHREQADALLGAVASLSPPQREAFLLREISGLSYDEIAGRLDSSVGAVQMLLFRARRALRVELEPPSVTRRPLLLPFPPWFAHFVGRSDGFSLVPRGAGALAAVAFAVGSATTVGVAVVADGSDARPLEPAQVERGSVGAPTPTTSEARTPARATLAAVRTPPTGSRAAGATRTAPARAETTPAAGETTHVEEGQPAQAAPSDQPGVSAPRVSAEAAAVTPEPAAGTPVAGTPVNVTPVATQVLPKAPTVSAPPPAVPPALPVAPPPLPVVAPSLPVVPVPPPVVPPAVPLPLPVPPPVAAPPIVLPPLPVPPPVTLPPVTPPVLPPPPLPIPLP